ncbi:hypothetical protein BDY17DRAFT_298190 [Neohortaea acidophila]|uniref:Probable endonuclease LCL3 n=1 Tax=Neohortaea acidophila TaxID=245834 RepID=A0A6A6PQM9_9PEZI|nr:uncharacterized protein BDY17DRAFT_298190 [Neohortaea acidophila]KAF2482245.1 hypothetical protein BDY17DRAFT_298190 [Neohortaea acidophila]
MQWPSWATLWRQSPNREDHDSQASTTACSTPPPSSPHPSKPAALGTWNNNLNATDWSHYTTPQTITISILTTATTLAFIRLWKTYLRRIPTVDYLKPGFFRKRNFYGYVTRVGDGDNFHFFHTPGGRWMGWGWLPGRKVQDMTSKAVRGQTMHVRIAGVDAPELAHFGRPEQPYSREAIEWLKSFILHQYVRTYPYRQDQYGRVVCSVYRRRWFFFKTDVGLNMLKRGLATVYEAKFGSEFGNREAEYRAAEEAAKSRKVGMWEQPGIVARMLGQRKKELESPREYKTRMAAEERAQKSPG